MNIKDCYPMRKRRSLDKTPGRSPNNDAGRLTPRRITSNHPLAEQGLDVIWDNNSPSPSRTLLLGKRKKRVGSDSSSSGGEISDLVKKLADKTGQTPKSNSLLNYWLEEESSHSDAAGDKHDGEQVKLVSKKRNLKTPCRRPRELRKSRRNKNKLSKELEMIANMMQDSEKVSTLPATSSHQSSSIVLIPIKTETTCTSPNSKDKTETKSSITNIKLKSPALPSANDLDGFNWEDDEGDVFLSQMDISALYDAPSKYEVSTNTHICNTQEESNQIPNCKLEKDAEDENSNLVDTSFVTESWEFDDDLDDEDNLLQTALEEVERTQSIVSNIPSTSQTNNSTSQMNIKEQTVFDMKNVKMEHPQSKPLYTKKENTTKHEEKVLEGKNANLKVKPSQSKPLFTKVKSTIKFEENRKALELTNPRMEPSRLLYNKDKRINYIENKNILGEKNPNLKVESSQSKPLYSKEEIERKKLQAQQKLKQKQKQKSLVNTKLNVYRSKKI